MFTYAKNPNVGPVAGWHPHKDIESSKYIIDNVFNGAECYAICEKENNVAIGAVEFKLNGYTDMTDKDDECELGYWLGEAFGCRRSLDLHTIILAMRFRYLCLMR